MRNITTYETVHVTFDKITNKINMRVNLGELCSMDFNEYCAIHQMKLVKFFETPFFKDGNTKVYGAIFERII